MSLSRMQSQLLLIDMQEKLLPAIDGTAGVLTGCRRLLTAARRLDVPVTVSEQYPKGLGSTVEALLTLLGNDAVRLPKVEFSCLRNAALHDRLTQLREGGRPEVIVAGIEAHVCVAQTVMDLLDDGCRVAVVADAVGSRTSESRDRALTRLGRHGAEIVDAEMVMFEWLERAGTPEFKELQATIKS